MCGITGAAWIDPGQALTENDLVAMMARLVHRGPDDAGVHRDDHAALGFRRLSIVDLSGGHQPLSNEDGTIWTVFNGEIYNFPALRHRLEARGHTLRSRGDTETLVHLYEDEGTAMFAHLRGMFALAIWDAPRRRLVLARDRLGQKPLVYRHDGTRILFASELKSLLALSPRDVPRRVDFQALDRYLTFGSVPPPFTILEGVHKLPPAHFAVWHDGRLTLDRYWNPDWNLERDRPEAEDAEQLRATLGEAVREQMVADVPLGAFLSGGVDSTIIAGLMQAASSRPVKTFSIGFEAAAYDESHYAEMAATHLGTEHHAFQVTPRAWELIPELAWQFDEPFADSSAIPTWYVSRETRREVTVALTGDGGDELFGGYDRYRAHAVLEWLERLPAASKRFLGRPFARSLPGSARPKTRARRLRRLLEGLGQDRVNRYSTWVGYFDEPARMALYSDDLIDAIARSDQGGADPVSDLACAFDAASRRDPVTQAMVADVLTYLPCDILCKVDMASMANSLECRGPFLDHRVVELALAMPLRRKLRLPFGASKAILKKTFAGYLPGPIRTRAKMGFGVPLDAWFRGPLKDELRSVLLDPVCLDRGLFRPEAVRSLVEDHVSGKENHTVRLWALLMLELWFRNHFDPARSRPVAVAAST